VNRLTTFLFGIVIAAIGWFVLENVGLDGLKDFRVTSGDESLTQTRGDGNRISPSAPPVQTGETIRIAAFNIQVFGTTKSKKPHVMDILARIAREFDIVAIQEIRAIDQDIIPNFVELINTTDCHYDYVIGPRLGRTSSKEQYAFVFDSATVEVDRSQLYTVADPDDLLHREPLVAWFRVRGPPPEQAFTFTLVNIHTDPDETKQELDALADVYRVVRDDGRQEDDVIILGDLNVDDRNLGRLGLIPGIMWVARWTAAPISAGLSCGHFDAGFASSAAIFSSAVPLPPEMIAPAWPIRLPGGAVRPAMNAATGLVTCCWT
jgi:deoxyribonuclease-1-like protein